MSYLRFDPESIFSGYSQFIDPNGAKKDLSSTFSNLNAYILTDIDIPIEVYRKLGAEPIDHSDLTPKIIRNGVFYVAYLCDSDALPALQAINKYGGRFIPGLSFAKTPYRYVDKLAYLALKKTCAKERLISHFDLQIHENICEALSITKYLQGDYVEIGVYKGGSALTALNYLDLQNNSEIKKTAWLFDTFDGFNYPEAESSADSLWYGTHKLYGIDKTINYIATSVLEEIESEFNIIPMNICSDLLPASVKQISVANIDVDLYDATLAALSKVDPLIVQGGIIIAEDPCSTPGLYGSFLALEEFMASECGKSYVKIHKGSQYFLLKVNGN